MKTTLLVLLLAISSAASAQYSPSHSKHSSSITVNNIERYGYDYIVPNYDFQGDSSILNNIELLNLERFRTEDSNVIVIDHVTKLEVMLIARKNIGRKGDNTVTE